MHVAAEGDPKSMRVPLVFRIGVSQGGKTGYIGQKIAKKSTSGTRELGEKGGRLKSHQNFSDRCARLRSQGKDEYNRESQKEME